jgi:hypothetical protein
MIGASTMLSTMVVTNAAIKATMAAMTAMISSPELLLSALSATITPNKVPMTPIDQNSTLKAPSSNRSNLLATVPPLRMD